MALVSAGWVAAGTLSIPASELRLSVYPAPVVTPPAPPEGENPPADQPLEPEFNLGKLMVPVRLSTQTGIASLTFRIVLSESAASWSSVSAAKMAAGQDVTAEVDRDDDRAFVVKVTTRTQDSGEPGPRMLGEGPLLMAVAVSADLLAPGTYHATLDDVVALDEAGNRVEMTTAAEPVRVVVPTEAAGDVNGDAKVDIRDVVQALRALIGLASLDEGARLRADVFPRRMEGAWGDGKVTVADAVRLLSYTAGLEPLPWPAGPPMAQASLGPKGGVLALPDGSVRLTVPAGALPETRTLSLSSASADAPTSLGSVELQPSGLAFVNPVLLTVKMDPAALPAEGNLYVDLVGSDGMVEELPVTTDRTTGTLTVPVSHFSQARVRVHFSISASGPGAMVQAGGKKLLYAVEGATVNLKSWFSLDKDPKATEVTHATSWLGPSGPLAGPTYTVPSPAPSGPVYITGTGRLDLPGGAQTYTDTLEIVPIPRRWTGFFSIHYAPQGTILTRDVLAWMDLTVKDDLTISGGKIGEPGEATDRMDSVKCQVEFIPREVRWAMLQTGEVLGWLKVDAAGNPSFELYFRGFALLQREGLTQRLYDTSKCKGVLDIPMPPVASVAVDSGLATPLVVPIKQMGGGWLADTNITYPGRPRSWSINRTATLTPAGG
jgi:hypothetical protein